MKDNKISENLKRFAKKKWDNFTDWFTDKEHPHSRLNKSVFFHDLLKIIGLILVFLIIYSNVDKINQIILIFIKLGSLLQLVLLFFILRKGWHLIKNLKYFFRGLNHGTKAIIAIVIVLLLFMAFLNQDKVVSSITQSYQEANFSKLNPIQVSANFSLFGSDKNSSSNKFNPYLSVSLKELSQNPQNYVGKNISISGDLVFRLGGYSLNSNDGYWVWIEDNCIEGQRNYNDGLHGTSGRYSAKGVWLAPKPKQYSWEISVGMESNYRIKCDSPLS